jgi:hypothetical protein
MSLDCHQRFLAVTGLRQIAAMNREPHLKNIAVGLDAVNDQNARRIVHEPQLPFESQLSRSSRRW